jgi:hypothetical protein
MCRRAVCETCQKPTYAGCGRHVEEVLVAVPRDARCSCPRAGKVAVQSATQTTPITYAYAISA